MSAPNPCSASRAGIPTPKSGRRRTAAWHGYRRMSDPVRLLTAISHALSAGALYGEEHPAVRRAVGAAYRELSELQTSSPQVAFTFLPGEVLFGVELIPELERWPWGARFAAAGIERLEVSRPVTEAELERFLL